jgi:hypothetical protein
MIFLHVAATIGLLMVSSLGPGLVFVRYLRWRPMETLCGSVALSFFFIYLTTFGIYILNLPPAWAYVPSTGAAIATLICVRDFRRLWKNRETRATLLAFLALFSWLLILLLLVREYSGGRWYGDWFEHFHRAGFFSAHLPLNTQFLEVFMVPARPPMMNLLAATIFWQVPTSFEVFQVTFAYLNALALLPCALIAPSLISRSRNRAWLIAGFLALNPMFLQNATYTWTKLFTAFYELTALGFYLSAWRRNDLSRMVAAFACFAMAMLVHYSAGPMIVFVVGHYLFFLFPHRKNRWRELAASAAMGSAIFATWLAWSIDAYGVKDTFVSNTTIMSSQLFSLSANVSKVANNIFNTLVPAFMRGGIECDMSYSPEMPPRGLAYARDWYFAVYQPSFPAALGLGALLITAALLIALYRRPPKDPWHHHFVFWMFLIIVVTIIGVAVHGESDYLGVAHICLQPLVLLGVTFAAIGLAKVPRWFRKLALAGLAFDAIFGVFLHFHTLQNHIDVHVEEFRDSHKVRASRNDLGTFPIRNAVLRSTHGLTFLGDHASNFAIVLDVAAALILLGILAAIWLLADYGRRMPQTTVVARRRKPAPRPQKRRTKKKR